MCARWLLHAVENVHASYWRDFVAIAIRQADERGHLDLQIDLRAGREMTAVLPSLQDIA
jgi:hypothetical protein